MDDIVEVEDLILKNLIYTENYTRTVLPFLKSEYFGLNIHKNIFVTISEYISKYNSRPTKEALIIELEKLSNLSQDEFDDIVCLLNKYHKDRSETSDPQWLLDSTEEFCQKSALHNAMATSIQIMSGKDDKHNEGEIPDMLTQALSISFDTHIGHDYIDDVSERWDFYHQKEKRIPFDIEYLNKITKGGVPSKTLNIIMGSTGTFKTGTLCHFSANYLTQGKNVLYITMEMAEERIAERIDANLLNIELDELKNISKTKYEAKVAMIKENTVGKLIIKEYPTASAHVGHFRHLIKELKMKKRFKPDVIIVDYLNICSSSRLRGNTNVGMYTYVKMIAEELRGLAVEFDVPIWSATQVNRAGFESSDVGLENTSESFGLPATSDLFLAIISTEELESLGQLMFKQLKNRYGDVNKYRRFMIGVNKAKMRLYDLEDSAQKDINSMNKSVSNNHNVDKKTKSSRSFTELKV